MVKKRRFPFNLQFFAEGDGFGSQDSAGDGDENQQEGGENPGGRDGSDDSGQKTFTQEEVTRMMTREKNQGKKSVLKSLGFKSEDEAKNAVKMLNTLLDLQKTPEDKANDSARKANDEKEEAEARASRAENKLSCLMAGVGNDSIDDVLAIALLKVSEDKDLDKVLAEMKKEKKYASFFGKNEDGSDSGTGSRPGHSSKDQGNKAGQFGRDLVEKRPASNAKRSSYFKED